MNLTKEENFYIIEDDRDDIKDFASFIDYKRAHFSNQNLIIDLLKYGTLTLEELLMFLKSSNDHRGDNKSFVIVNDTINIDTVPDELMVVPTLQEAKDVIQMEDIERDLRF